MNANGYSTGIDMVLRDYFFYRNRVMILLETLTMVHFLFSMQGMFL